MINLSFSRADFNANDESNHHQCCKCNHFSAKWQKKAPKFSSRCFFNLKLWVTQLTAWIGILVAFWIDAEWYENEGKQPRKELASSSLQPWNLSRPLSYLSEWYILFWSYIQSWYDYLSRQDSETAKLYPAASFSCRDTECHPDWYEHLRSHNH